MRGRITFLFNFVLMRPSLYRIFEAHFRCMSHDLINTLYIFQQQKNLFYFSLCWMKFRRSSNRSEFSTEPLQTNMYSDKWSPSCRKLSKTNTLEVPSSISFYFLAGQPFQSSSGSSRWIWLNLIAVKIDQRWINAYSCQKMFSS